MARVEKGALNTAIIQPDRTIIEKNDGTLEGNIIWKVDAGNLGALPDLDDLHPDNYKLECYNKTISYGTNGIVTCQASYFGLESSPTDAVIDYSGGQNNDPIETHPDFETFAGTVTAPLNGARFVTDTAADDYGSFIEFGGGEDANGPQYKGVEYYLTPSTQVTLSYWTSKVPRLKTRLKIYKKIPFVSSRQFRQPPDVVDWLLLDTPYRQVGNFYQVTEQFLGSGPNGWNNVIYEEK